MWSKEIFPVRKSLSSDGMKVIESIKEMQAWAEEKRSQGKSIGFVPTMGFLHEGHLSLVKASKQACDATVVSIFVNPTQFSPEEDFEKYPRDFEKDKRLCEGEGVEAIFYPSEKEMYAEPLTDVNVESLTERLCGLSRPNHFKGVTLVCSKLFNAVKPHKAFFGLKDYQQCRVVEKMVKDLNLDLEIVSCPLVREEDGLALSSRNQYLSEEERKEALGLSQGLKAAKELFLQGETSQDKLVERVRSSLENSSGVIEYIELVNPTTLEKVSEAKKGDVILMAVQFGKTRLIDNMVMA
jgi:pantoate--beta-alanine ligase